MSADTSSLIDWLDSSLRHKPAQPEATATIATEALRRLSGYTRSQVHQALHDWSLWARPDQREPPGDWTVWLLMGGRGSGKTRTGAEWVRDRVKKGCRRIALVAETAADARDVMVEGDSGILACSWEGDRDYLGRPMGVPRYEPSKRRVTWANGAQAWTYNAVEPGQLRGPQHDAAWADEIAKWRYDDAWDQLMFGLRLGTDPRCIATTTPRPRKLIRSIRDEVGTVTTGASTYANRAFLARQFVDMVVRRYEGTRLGRQELHGVLLNDTPGALWSLDLIDSLRVPPINLADMRRIVVAVDPAASSEDGSNENGIVVAGADGKGHYYVIADLSLRGSPEAWATTAIRAYDRYSADCIVPERNNGGDMVPATIRAAATAMKAREERTTDVVAIRTVWASRGKAIRAEPVSALYEQRRVHHAGAFHELEDQMSQFTLDYDRTKDGSPDRLDALVWAITELSGGSGIPVVGPGEVSREGGSSPNVI